MLTKILKLFFIILCLIATPAHATTKYINSVTPESLTIASGATTASTTVPAATGTYFLLWGGSSTTATTSSAQGFCYVTLSGTTLTATRTTSSTNTCTANVTLVDATANLVTSVQRGTIAITTGTSNTATISSVTTANSSVNILGHSNGNSTFDFEIDDPYLVLTSGTVVTATVGALLTSSTVSYQVINWNASALNQSTQPFLTAWTNSATSTTQTITSVNTANAMLLFAGNENGNTTKTAVDEQIGEITSSTAVTISTGIADGDAIKYAGTVIEFVPGVLTQTAQRGITTIAASTSSKTDTITSAATNASALNLTGWTSTTTVLTSLANIVPRHAQASATTITSNVGGTVPSAKTTQSGWEVLTFSNSSTTPAVQCVPTGAQTAGLIYPIYTDPPSGIYSGLITLMGSNPNVPVIVILNPNSGPGASANAAYTTAIGQLQSAGAIVLGYIETGYGVANADFTPQNETTMKADIASWQSFYPAINGIFIDEMDDTGSATACTSISGGSCVALYQALTTYAHGLGLPLTYGNPGENTISAYFSSSPPAVDRYMVYETNAYGVAANYNNAGLCSYTNCASVVYALAYSSTNLTLMMKNSSWVFMTDDHATNPYDAAPTYLSTEMAAISSFNSGGTGTSCAMVPGFP